jgi:hypothetical protein
MVVLLRSLTQARPAHRRKERYAAIGSDTSRRAGFEILRGPLISTSFTDPPGWKLDETNQREAISRIRMAE